MALNSRLHLRQINDADPLQTAVTAVCSFQKFAHSVILSVGRTFYFATGVGHLKPGVTEALREQNPQVDDDGTGCVAEGGIDVGLGGMLTANTNPAALTPYYAGTKHGGRRLLSGSARPK